MFLFFIEVSVTSIIGWLIANAVFHLAWQRTDRRSQLVPSHMPTSSHKQHTHTPKCGKPTPWQEFSLYLLLLLAHWHSFPWQMCPSPAPRPRPPPCPLNFPRRLCLPILEFCRLVFLFSTSASSSLAMLPNVKRLIRELTANFFDLCVTASC